MDIKEGFVDNENVGRLHGEASERLDNITLCSINITETEGCFITTTLRDVDSLKEHDRNARLHWAPHVRQII